MGKSRNKKPLIPILFTFFGVLLALAIGWGVGLIVYANAILGERGGIEPSADAIAVLTGGSGRLEAGLKLLSVKRGKKLFVSGVYKGVDVKRLMTLYQQAPADSECCVEIGDDAINTAGNAIETAAWFSRQKYKSLIIVTSNYHMPRSFLEFRYAMPDAKLIAYPVFPENFKREQWWAWPGTTGLLMREYSKYLLAWMRHAGLKLLKNLTPQNEGNPG
jgi:uncharacterized SAM-binding protein YcdF (DUF218 family)